MKDQKQILNWTNSSAKYCVNLQKKIARIDPNKFQEALRVINNPDTILDDIVDIDAFIKEIDRQINLIRSNVSRTVKLDYINKNECNVSVKEALTKAFKLYKTDLKKNANNKYFDEIKIYLKYCNSDEDTYDQVVNNLDDIFSLKIDRGDAILEFVLSIYKAIPSILKEDRNNTKEKSSNETVKESVYEYTLEEIKNRYELGLITESQAHRYLDLLEEKVSSEEDMRRRKIKNDYKKTHKDKSSNIHKMIDRSVENRLRNSAGRNRIEDREDSFIDIFTKGSNIDEQIAERERKINRLHKDLNNIKARKNVLHNMADRGKLKANPILDKISYMKNNGAKVAIENSDDEF